MRLETEKKEFTMKKHLAALLIACSLLLAGGHALAEVGWEVVQTWQLPEDPRDVAVSGNGQWVFFLTRKNSVAVFQGDGTQVGELPAPAGVDRIIASENGDVLYLKDSEKKTLERVMIYHRAEINTEGSPFMGRADAPVEIVEFSDFQCPFCASVPPMLEEVLEKNPDTVKLVFKHFPLAFHKQAEPAARASLAAANQGKFWPYHDKLFANGKTLTDDSYKKIAEELGLDVERLLKDMDSPTVVRKVRQDILDAQRIGVNSTPSLFVNGWRLTGKRTAENIQELVDRELAQIKKNGDSKN